VRLNAAGDAARADDTAEYANIDVPTAIVRGAHHGTLPMSMSYKLCAQICSATLGVVARLHALAAP
jgi:hypothetical protein